jgi:hypothetical protein
MCAIGIRITFPLRFSIFNFYVKKNLMVKSLDSVKLFQFFDPLDQIVHTIVDVTKVFVDSLQMKSISRIFVTFDVFDVLRNVENVVKSEIITLNLILKYFLGFNTANSEVNCSLRQAKINFQSKFLVIKS